MLIKVTVGSLSRRIGRDLERTILELYKHVLGLRDLDRDNDGRFYKENTGIEIDIHIYYKVMNLIEVKTHVECKNVEQFQQS